MAKKKFKRLHSDDSRFLRSLLMDMMARIVEIEIAVGELQATVDPAPDSKEIDNV